MFEIYIELCLRFGEPNTNSRRAAKYAYAHVDGLAQDCSNSSALAMEFAVFH